MLYKSIRYFLRGRERPHPAATLRGALALALVALLLFVVDAGAPVHAQSTSSAKMYWTDQSSGNNTIKQADLDGRNVETLSISGLAGPDGIEVDPVNSKLYWVRDANGDAIKRANLDGGGVETVVSTGTNPIHLALDIVNSKVYWTREIDRAVWRANLDGTGSEELYDVASTYPYGIALDLVNSKMYWTGLTNNTIKRANLDGTSVETLISTGLNTPRGIEVDAAGGKMYWASGNGQAIKRADLNGGNVETIVDVGVTTPYDVALDLPNGKIYWVDDGNNTIKRANLDGSGVETVVSSGLDKPRGIAIPAATDVPRVSVSTVTESTVVLDWDDIEDATDYQYRYKASSETEWSEPVTVSDSTVLVTGLTAGTAYDFQARSRENGVANNWSGTASVATSTRALEISRWPARVGGVVVISQGTGGAQLQWQHQINAGDYQIGLWEAGQVSALPLQAATATITIPEVWEQVSETLGVWSGTIYPEFTDDEETYVGTYEDDPSKVVMLQHRRYEGDILYYWNTGIGRWRVLRCKTPSNGGCDYGTPSATDTRQLVTVSSSVFNWFNLDAGPPEWGGVYRNEDDALEAAESAGATVIFLDALNYARYSRLNTSTPSAIIDGLPDGRQYLGVRGITSDGREGEWSYLVTVGSAAAAPRPVSGAPVEISGLIYTDEVPNVEHYLLDETTLVLSWQNIPGARHYDVRLNGEVTRITAQASSGQQLAVSLAKLQGSNLSYQLRAVIETGSLDVRVTNAEGYLVYIVPPDSVVYSRWSADRSVNVERLGMIRGPGTEGLLVDPEPPDDLITKIIGDLLKLTTLMDEDAEDGEVQLWVVPLGMLGSIFMGGLTGYGARRGGMDKAAIIAGGLVFFVCWAYLCPVYLKIPWPVIFSVIVLVIGAAIAIALNDWLR